MYALLQEQLGEGALALRTISGDVTSNGTVAERGFVEREARAAGDIPTVAVKGDHDTGTTVQQLAELGVANPDLEVAEVGGLDVVAANDPAFKALFGGLVINDTGVTESELGAALRTRLDAARPHEPIVVLLHQPRSAAGYIGVDALRDLPEGLDQNTTTPWDDGIPDLPPGIINLGHLHDAAPPRVIWNTDGDEVTWTVLNQLGTSGGVEEYPTFNRFSTPFSAPLKTLSLQLQYVDVGSGLQTGYASLEVAPDGSATITDREDIGLSGVGIASCPRFPARERPRGPWSPGTCFPTPPYVVGPSPAPVEEVRRAVAVLPERRVAEVAVDRAVVHRSGGVGVVVEPRLHVQVAALETHVGAHTRHRVHGHQPVVVPEPQDTARRDHEHPRTPLVRVDQDLLHLADPVVAHVEDGHAAHVVPVVREAEVGPGERDQLEGGRHR